VRAHTRAVTVPSANCQLRGGAACGGNESDLQGLTNGAPRNAISNGTFFSFVRHWTQGSLAKVAIPEKMESAVTGKQRRKRIVKHPVCT
jgi:hypothetical protein